MNLGLKALNWNCHGFKPAKVNEVKCQVQTNPDLRFVGISEIQRDLTTNEMIPLIESCFPSSDWLQHYTPGSGAGKGLFTAVKLPKNRSCEATIKTVPDCADNELAHEITLKSGNLNYALSNYYVSPSVKTLSVNFKNLLDMFWVEIFSF